MRGRISIRRPQYSDGRKLIEIQLNDELSGTRFCEVAIGYDDFAACLTGLSNVPMEFELVAGNVGKRHEHKTESVIMPKHAYKDRATVAKEALAPFEVDGWRGRIDDLSNMHRHLGNDVYNVTFHRFVDVAPLASETMETER